MGILEKLFEMTAFSNIAVNPAVLLMFVLAFVLLYLGIKKGYEPLLLVPIGFGVLLANFPGGEMGVIQATEENGIMHMTLLEIAHDYGIMNYLYYSLIKT
ncbi:MAG: sodium ion-translocating decarboxylase subunit beta, partial [Rikenellaceae bacterium]|nr:sodium ion-translocating decarboxylase subunit beta [Rikenellaceae bacterium]